MPNTPHIQLDGTLTLKDGKTIPFAIHIDETSWEEPTPDVAAFFADIVETVVWLDQRS